jgi:hypothetical protein
MRMKTAAIGCSPTTLLSGSVAGEANSPVMPVLLPAEGGRLRRPPAGPALKW